MKPLASSMAFAAVLWLAAWSGAAPMRDACAQPLPLPRSLSIWDGVYTAEQARRGGDVYARECANCHGPTLKERDGAPPLAAPEFLANWNGFSAADLFERIRRTMPTGAPGSLSAQDYSDLLALILGANQLPAGAMELDGRDGRLRQIRIEAVKPQSPQGRSPP
jgi:S-disulfanyl-L-cysteine oxidoreductase SoxD